MYDRNPPPPAPTWMVFKAPGSETIHGHRVTFKVIGEDAVDDHLADGWYLTATEAGEAKIAADKAEHNDDKADTNTAPTREEIEQKLAELGVTFDRRLGDKKLLALIDETLKQRQG